MSREDEAGMGVRIDITYKGDLRCEAVHGPSGDILVTDAPKDNQGEGRYFSPTDLTAASMGTCILTIMGIAARARDLDIAGAGATVVKEMSAVPRRHISRLRMEITLPSALEERSRKLLERTATTCPVKQSLGPGTEVDLSFRYE